MAFHEGPIALDTMADGAALELFEEGLKEVLGDIDKASKKTTAKRGFSLKFTFEADENGCSTRYAVELVSIVRAPGKAAVGSAVISHEHALTEMLDVRQARTAKPDNVLSHRPKE